MAHNNDMRSSTALIHRFIGTDYDKIMQISNHLPELLELLAFFQQQQSNNLTDANFVFTQNTLSPLWNIHHTMGKFPSVSVINQDGELMGGIIDHIDEDNLTISFSVPVKGTATLN